jgi:hypothetical protein
VQFCEGEALSALDRAKRDSDFGGDFSVTQPIEVRQLDHLALFG